MMQLLSKIYFSAIINESASALAVVSDNDTSSNLNYIIGGLILIIIVLVGSTLFTNKR